MTKDVRCSFPGLRGFCVVRLPKFARRGRLDYTKTLGGRSYWGVDRLPWEGIGVDFYTGELSGELKFIMRKVEETASPYSLSAGLCVGWEDARTVLAYCNRSGIRNELIWISSSRKLPPRAPRRRASKWIGIDVVPPGEWSLIYDGVFRAPAHFPRWVDALNPHGLLEQADPDLLSELLSDYQRAASEGAVEPIQPNPTAIGLHVWRVPGDQPGEDPNLDDL